MDNIPQKNSEIHESGQEKRNEDIQKGAEGRPSIVQKIKKWREHIEPMDAERSPKLVEGKRNRGRPRRRAVDITSGSSNESTPQTDQ